MTAPPANRLLGLIGPMLGLAPDKIQEYLDVAVGFMRGIDERLRRVEDRLSCIESLLAAHQRLSADSAAGNSILGSDNRENKSVARASGGNGATISHSIDTISGEN